MSELDNEDTAAQMRRPFCDHVDRSVTRIIETVRTSDEAISMKLCGLYVSADNILLLSEVLSKKRCVTHLNLGSNHLSGNTLQCLALSLKHNIGLRALDLSYNDCLVYGSEQLGLGLRENTSLLTSNLFANSIGSAGVRHVADALKTNKCLTCLQLGGNGVTADGAIHLASALESNRTLNTLFAEQ